MAIKTDPSKNIPTHNSYDAEWIQWHKDLKRVLGKKTANSLFIQAWGKRGDSSANTRALRNYLAKYKVTLDESAYDKIVDLGGDLGDSIASSFKISKVMMYSLGFILVGGVAMIVYNIGKNPVGAAQAALSLKSGGLKK